LDKLFDINPIQVGASLDLDPIFPRFQRRFDEIRHPGRRYR